MHWIKILRKKLGLSQARLASYLGVSRSLICHIERYDREIPSEILNKIYKLEKAFDESGMPALYDECLEKEKKELRSILENARRKSHMLGLDINILKYRLVKVGRAHDKCTAAIKTNNALSFRHCLGEAGKGDESWVKISDIDTKAAYDQNNTSRQKTMQLQIDLMEAEKKVYDAFILENTLRLTYVAPEANDSNEVGLVVLRAAG